MCAFESKREAAPNVDLLQCSDKLPFDAAQAKKDSCVHGSIGPEQDGTHTNGQLAAMIDHHPSSSPFSPVQDPSLFTNSPRMIPPGRHGDGLYARNEDYFIQSINSRMDAGDIDERTLVVAMTGHGPTIGWAMAQRYGSDVYLSFPDGLDSSPTNRCRNFKQAQTFFALISGLRGRTS